MAPIQLSHKVDHILWIIHKKLLHRLGNAEIKNTYYTIVVLARPEVVNDNNLGYIDEP